MQLRGKSSMVPLQTPNINELWMAPTIRVRTTQGRAANLRATPPRAMPYPELRSLAVAVMTQAIFDANPAKKPNRGGRYKPFDRSRVSREALRIEYDALRFLTDRDDPWMPFWADLAGYYPHSLRHTFWPIRMKFEMRYGLPSREPQPAVVNTASVCA